MADGSIILDTRVNTKGAEADLKALQAKAKSTAQQIAAVEKDYNSTTSKHSKLGEDLRRKPQRRPAKSKILTGHWMTRMMPVWLLTLRI